MWNEWWIKCLLVYFQTKYNATFNTKWLLFGIRPNIKKFYVLPQGYCMLLKVAIIKLLVFKIEKKCVYWAVVTEALNVIQIILRI